MKKKNKKNESLNQLLSEKDKEINELKSAYIEQNKEK